MKDRWCLAAGSLALTVALGGCSLVDQADPPASSQSPADVTVSAASPAPASTVTVTAPAAHDMVLLTDQGIGPVVFATPDAYSRLVTLLGEASEPPTESCSFWLASWGALTVYLDGPDQGATGWTLSGGPLADQIRPPYDVYPGDPIRPLLDKGAHPQPVYSMESPEEVSQYQTSLGAYAWYSPTADPDSPVSTISVEAPGCD